MKAFSLIKFMTFVSTILITSGVAWGQGANVAVSGQDYLAAITQQENSKKESECRAAITKISDTKAKESSTCKAAGFDVKTCASALDDCNDELTEEQPLLLPQITGMNMFSFDTGEKSCSTLTQEQYDTKQDKLERKEDKITDDLSRAKKDQERDEKDYQEDSTKLQNEINDLIGEKSKADFEDKENDRKAEGEEKIALEDLRKRIRESENKIIDANGKLEELANQRIQRVSIYKNAILQCKLEAEKAAAERKKMPKQSGSLSSAARSGSNNNSIIQEIYHNCVNGVISQRTADEGKYKTEVTRLNKFIADTDAEIKEMKSSEQLAMQQSAQSKIDKAKSREERDQNFLSKYKTLVQQSTAADNLMTQKRQRAALEVNQAQQKANKASNELSSFGMKKPMQGDKKVGDIRDAIDNAGAALSSCYSICESVDLSSRKRCDDAWKRAGGSSSSSSSGGAK